MADGQHRRAERTEAFRRLVKRILTSLDGKFEASPPPQLLKELTDEDIIVAVDAVEAVVAEQQPRPSGRAQFRLLAWTVADARGAVRPLDMAAAEAVGKRLHRQAQRVRDAMDAVSADAREARLQLTDAQGVPAIDAQEQSRLESLRAEVYVGFHELEALLPGDAAPPVHVAEPVHAVLAAALESADIASKLAAATQTAEENIPPIPAELALCLGRDGVQALWDHRMYMHEPCERCPITDSKDWYDLLPGLVGQTLLDSRIAYQEGRIDGLEAAVHSEALLDKAQEQVKQLQARVRELEGLPPMVTSDD